VLLWKFVLARVATFPLRRVIVCLLTLCLAVSALAAPNASADYDHQESQVIIHAPALAAGGPSGLSESMRDRLRERVGASAKVAAISFVIPAAPAPEVAPASWVVPIQRPERRSARALSIRAPPVHLQKLS
jgi:hypothetical protein